MGEGEGRIVGTDFALLVRLARSAGAEVPERRSLAISLMVVAACLFSTSPVLVRWAAPLSPALITSGRMLIAGLAIATLALIIGSPGPNARQLRRLALYGLIAALHFQLYVASLSYTTVAHSLTLVYTSPVFVAIFTWIMLGERLSAGKLLGLPVVLVGVALIAGFETRLDPRMALGDLMAVGSALCYGLYSVAGRAERRTVPVATYAATVYTTAGIWLLPIALVAPGESRRGRLQPVDSHCRARNLSPGNWPHAVQYGCPAHKSDLRKFDSHPGSNRRHSAKRHIPRRAAHLAGAGRRGRDLGRRDLGSSKEIEFRNMFVGMARLIIDIPASGSLKDKRRVVKSVLARVNNHLKLATAEIGHLDSWQTAEVGLACVSGSPTVARQVIERAVRWIEDTRPDVELISIEIQVLQGE